MPDSRRTQVCLSPALTSTAPSAMRSSPPPPHAHASAAMSATPPAAAKPRSPRMAPSAPIVRRRRAPHGAVRGRYHAARAHARTGGNHAPAP